MEARENTDKPRGACRDAEAGGGALKADRDGQGRGRVPKRWKGAAGSQEEWTV